MPINLISPCRYFFLWLLLSVVTSLPLHAVESPPEKIIEWQARFLQEPVESEQIVDLEIELDVIDAHYLYADQTKILWPADFAARHSTLEFQPVQRIYDKYAKKEKDILRGKVKILTTVELPRFSKSGSQSLPLGLRYQACSDYYCLLPKTKFIDLQFRVQTSQVDQSLGDPGQRLTAESLSFDQALERGWWFTFLFVFLAGVLTSFTPCVFPMIPITLAVIGSQAKDSTRWQSFLLSLFYVLGIALTYAGLGLLAAQTGALFGSMMSNPLVIGAIAGILVMMALSMFDVFEIRTPQFISQRLLKNKGPSGYPGAFVAGLVAGVVASPCVGPVLVGILAFVAKTQSLSLGFFLLFTFALGLGLLFLLLGSFSHWIQYLPKSGPWMNFTKFLFGISMLALALYFASPLMPREWMLGIIGFGSMCLGFALGFLQRDLPGPIRWLRRLVGSVGMFVGAGFLVYSGITYQEKQWQGQVRPANKKIWQAYSKEALAASTANSRPVLIDFTAEWCAACKELEEKTFATSEFKQLAQNFDLYFIDATDAASVQELVEQYQVLGLPTVIFIDGNGQIREDLRVSGFEEIEAFAKRMRTLLEKK